MPSPARLKSFVVFVLGNFGPLLVFYGLNHFWGLKPAIAATVVFTLIEVAWTLIKKERVTGIFLFTTAMTLGFGAVDLYSQESFLFKYEASVTNLFTGLFFGGSLFARKTLIEEVYEKSKNARPMTPDLAAFFRLLTGMWTLYFFVKAVAYFWMARHFGIEKALLIRGVVGNVSLFVMLGISILFSRRLFLFLRKKGRLSSSPGVSVIQGD